MISSNKAKTIILILLISRVGAQSGSVPTPPDAYYANFSPSMAVIIAVLISALFFMGFFSIYIRHCTDMSSISPSAAARNLGASLRGRAAGRGLDPSLLETFPTFAYSEVKDKKIGKGVLECAVCLNEFAEEDRLRLIPRCDHVFHPECIDTWLASHVTCPVCRANLNEPPEQPEPTEPPNLGPQQTGEVSVRITDDPLSRSWSVSGKVFPKFPRSHSTGHSVVQPLDNRVDRFTLRLPEELRNQVMTRALDRTSSCVAGFPTESSSRSGYRTGFDQSLKRVDPVAKSDRWVFSMAPPFFSRGPSMSRKGDGDVADGEGSTSAKTPRGSTMRLPSFKCLEPKGDETCLISEESRRPPV